MADQKLTEQIGYLIARANRLIEDDLARRLQPGGIAIEWTTASGRVYEVGWSTQPQDGYTSFGDALALPWTQTSYTDTTHGADQQLQHRVSVRLE